MPQQFLIDAAVRAIPWQQEHCEARGEVKVRYNQCFTIPLSVTARVPEWDGQERRLGLEEGVVFTQEGCPPLDGRQVNLHLV